ncbi:NAD(P)/FAD-dependent oxidoreductase [Actinoalloteichus caeruleus]|uniref:Reductase C-terminal n=1 Tax=Actinoalloteichus caeruleus DSM 43889 TaxID=1120930 RepID=A0ABT1JF53_ACTCY|nr:FAD-dependent oxidoreductase [Actinoalloteichus caeruleus]MCP2330854.1 Reductase C-terminal [Actinoalloteichus caeruleus DSM 43889]
MNTPAEVLVVGASAAGLATVEALRRRGYTDGVTLLGAETHPPYDRPPLSKQVLAGAWAPDRVRLRQEDALDALDVRVVLGDPAVSLDAGKRVVRTASGRLLRSDVVVLATGVRPRTFPGQDGLAGVHVLRTLDDCLALREDLRPGTRLVVVGDGVLGAEVAATARAAGHDVTLTGPQAAPLEAQLGPLVAGLLRRTHADNGVRLRLGRAVTGLVAREGRITGVALEGGEEIPAEVVLVALGSVPNTDWLAGSGLDLTGGVRCDSRCRAADGVYAVGDVAHWFHEGLGVGMRLENRTNATEQAGVVAQNILGADRPYTPVPYFWTDQFDARLQVHGLPPRDAEVTVEDGELGSRGFVAVYRREGRPVGVLGWNMPKQARRLRQRLLGPPPARTAPTAVDTGQPAVAPTSA